MKIKSEIKVGNNVTLGFSAVAIETTCHGFLTLHIPIKDSSIPMEVELHRGELREFLARTVPEFQTTEFQTTENYKAEPPKGPFWAWNDIGSGLKWHLCVMRGSTDEPLIYYVEEDFEDFWYDDDWEDGDIQQVRPPTPQGGCS